MDGALQDLQFYIEKAADIIPLVLSDICNSLVWFFQTTLSQVTNREIATTILLLSVLLFAVVKIGATEVIRGLWDVVIAALSPKILIPGLLLILYSMAIFWGAYLIGIWSSEVLLDTILEVSFIGLPSLAIAVKANSVVSVYRQFVVPEIGFSAIVAFYIGIESFSLPVEIGLQLVICFFAALQVVGRHEPKGGSVAKFSSCILSIIGLGIVVVVSWEMALAWNEINWGVEIETLAMAFYYPILMVPAIVALGYYAAYEILGIRIKIGSKGAKFLVGAYLYSSLFPSLVAIKHFNGCEVANYIKCSSWKERSQFVKKYKGRLGETSAKENAKLRRRDSGFGKRGFDGDGIWLDWENLEEIKTNLRSVASIQNRNWEEEHVYAANMQEAFVDAFTPSGCTSGSCVSSDRGSYVCWMSNGTGFTFGIGACEGSFPPLRYEGLTPPVADVESALMQFVNVGDRTVLPHWNMDFHVDDTYR